VRHGANINMQDEDGRTALNIAAEKGNVGVMQLLVQEGANVNIQDKDGRTALNIAAEKGNVGVVQLLVQEGANVNIQDKDGRTALDWVMDSAKLGVLEVNILRAQDKQKALQLAVEKEDEAIIQLLVDKGVDVKTQNGQRALQLAVDKGWRHILLLLLQKGVDVKTQNGQRALQLAVDNGWMDILLQLLRKDVDVKTENGQKALLWATELRRDDRGGEAVQLLVEGRVKVSEPDSDGVTALQRAVHRNNKIAVGLLLGGAGFETKDALKALEAASGDGYLEIAKLLLPKVGDVNEPNSDGQTVLHKAAAAGRWKIVQLLVENGADPDITDSDGYTPEDLAEEQKHYRSSVKKAKSRQRVQHQRNAPSMA
jgi:serine/threonine-protein phosphatase 6 regulatory ankyrin repeat subunit B